MDYTEILALYGWDAEAASEAVKEIPSLDLVEEVLVNSAFD